MVVNGLLPLVHDAIKHVHISDYSHKKAAVDASDWIYEACKLCANQIANHQNSTEFVIHFMDRVQLLLKHDITPIIVFDGCDLPAKKFQIEKVHKYKSEQLQVAKKLENQGLFKEANEHYQNSIEITPKILCPLYDQLREDKIEFIVAPYDADAQLAYLAYNEIVDLVITNDSDLLVYQSPLTLFNLDCDGYCQSLSRKDLMNLPFFNQMDQNMIIESCVLGGCDYLPPIPKMGIRTAMKCLLTHKTGLNVISVLRTDAKWEVPDNYEQNFQDACSIFTQQRVFDKSLMSVVGIFDECVLDIAGPSISDYDAINIAFGRMDPKTRKLFDPGKSYELQKSGYKLKARNSRKDDFDECNDSNISNSFFTFANLRELKYKNGDEFVLFLKEKAVAEGFQLVLSLKRVGEYIILKCQMHNNKTSPCCFRINLQAHNINTSEQCYEITKSTYLRHNHELNTLRFAHLSLDLNTKEIVKTMHAVNIDSTKISEFLYKHKKIRITTKQITNLFNRNKENADKEETELLIQKIKNENGFYKVFPPENVESDDNSRLAIASFTPKEMYNLQNFGDMICIDPTYPCLTSGWTTIPITVVGKSRELLSGGVIFCSSVTSNIYEWIIKLIVYVLPCSNLVRTICSDDDIILESVWEDIIADPKCSHIKRIICMFHKMCKFSDIIKKLGFTSKQQEEIKEKFHLMAFTRNELKCKQLLNELKELHPQISSFIETSIENRLFTSVKAFTKETLSLGYISNVYSECNNSNIKKLLGSRASTLVEMRDIITRSEERRQMNREYIKSRKISKILDQRVSNIMQKFNVEQPIAEAIVGSIQKGEYLQVELHDNEWIVFEEKTKDTYIVSNKENFDCTCGKLSSTGLPCSHILKVLEIEKIDLENISNIISKRWILSEEEMKGAVINLHDDSILLESRLNYRPTTVRQRYVKISAKIQSIANLASHTQEKYEKAMIKLDNVENDLLGVSKVKDAKPTKCGRPRKSRIKKIERKCKCQICNKNHSTFNCPDLEDVRRFIDFTPDKKKGGKSCHICTGSGHFARTCPALKKWRESKNADTENDESYEEEYDECSEIIGEEYDEEI